MNISKLERDRRAVKALTGLTYQEFSDLIPVFEKALSEIRKQRPNRKRKVGGGKKGKLPTAGSKLFFILFYLKTYPTFDVLAFFTDRQRSHCCESIAVLSKALLKTLGKKIVLPERKIHSVGEFLQKFPAVKDIFLDGTERRIQRPKKNKTNRKYYSGKKKTHTRKNIIATDENKRILLVSPTKAGRRHDKRLADKISLIEKIPKNIGIWADSGFQGIQRLHPNTLVCKKGRKNHPLTSEEKKENKIISSFRMRVEHAIGGLKRYRALSDTFRNKIGWLDDLFIELAGGLWNYHLSRQES
jgi:hypothetical protein